MDVDAGGDAEVESATRSAWKARAARAFGGLARESETGANYSNGHTLAISCSNFLLALGRNGHEHQYPEHRFNGRQCPK